MALCRVFSFGYSAKILSRAKTDARRKKSNVTERRRLRRVCRVSNLRHSANYASLPSVKVRALGKVSSFAECQSSGTRQSFFLCRVSCFRHSAKVLPLPCVKVQALGKASSFAVCQVPDTRQTRPRMLRILASLPSVIAQTLDKEAILVPECTEFCHVYTLPSVLTLELDKRPLSCHK